MFACVSVTLQMYRLYYTPFRRHHINGVLVSDRFVGSLPYSVFISFLGVKTVHASFSVNYVAL